MARGDFATAIKLLPSTFREVYSHPKICEQVKAIGVAPVKATIQVQLGILASLMTVGGNLNDTMANFIAGSLIDMFPTESIADFQLCFQRGAMGRYGSIQRMDGITIGEWMGQYLEEKYSELETQIQKRKGNETDKKPVEGLEHIYKQMADETNKVHMVRNFERDEMQKRFGVTLTPYLCDGIEIYAKSLDEAAKYFKETTGTDPETVTVQKQ